MTKQIESMDVVQEKVVLPASYIQEVIWTIETANPDKATYNVPRSVQLRGMLRISALRAALSQVVERHEILRTLYEATDETVVQIILPTADVPFEFHDLTRFPEPNRLAAAEQIVQEHIALPFDLQRQIPLRVVLLKLADQDHVLHIDTHHIASDGRSRIIFFEELCKLYQAAVDGTPAQLPELAIQYGDYAVWERQRLQADRLKEMQEFWHAQLEGRDFILDLPTDFPRRADDQEKSLIGTLHIDEATADALRRFAREHDASVYMVVLAAYQILLHRYSGQPDILVGSPLSGRNRPEVDALIGCFVNILPICTHVDEQQSFTNVLTQARERFLNGLEHSELPFDKIFQEFQGHARQVPGGLLRAVLTSIDLSESIGETFADLVMSPFRNTLDATKYDLTLFLREGRQALTLMLRARAGLWRESSISLMLEQLQKLLTAALAEPTRPLREFALVEPESTQACSTSVPVQASADTGISMNTLLEYAIAHNAERIALVAGDVQLSYAELNREIVQLAQRLRKAGVAVGQLVGSTLDRSCEAIVAMCAILRVGAVFVPLSQPRARMLSQLEESAVRLVLIGDTEDVDLPSHVRTLVVAQCGSSDVAETDFVAPEVSDDALAYVLYTSGSTGRPKGVAVGHAQLVHYTRAVTAVLTDTVCEPLEASLSGLCDRQCALVSSLAVDLGYTVLFPALCSGATLHVLPLDISTDPQRFEQYLAKHAIDILKITPSQLQALLPDASEQKSLCALPQRWLILGGEQLTLNFAAFLAQQDRCRILNHYGPTETTVGACTFEVSTPALAQAKAAGAMSVPIGAPLPGVHCFVADAYGRALPENMVGELWIGGEGVAQGYYGGQTGGPERFVLTAAGQRFYRTGDKVRWLSGGMLEYLGRLDHQIKLRGFRIEIGEIEAALLAQPEIRSAAVVVHVDGNEAALVAHVVTSAAQTPNLDEHIFAQLRELLPAAFIPSVLMVHATLPTTLSGKIDRLTLAQVAPAMVQTKKSARGMTVLEQEIANIWSEVFRREITDPTTDFFALGGHSLLAIRIMGRIQKAYRRNLPLSTLFANPNVRQLAVLLDKETEGSEAPTAPKSMRGIGRGSFRQK